jgi:hypothetical protein
LSFLSGDGLYPAGTLRAKEDIFFAFNGSRKLHEVIKGLRPHRFGLNGDYLLLARHRIQSFDIGPEIAYFFFQILEGLFLFGQGLFFGGEPIVLSGRIAGGRLFSWLFA